MAIKNPKTPRVTRRAKKTAALYKANPTWAKEDAMGAYRKGGSTRTLRKAQTGETGAADTEPVTVADTPKPKDKDFVNMSNKEYRAEKKGVKRTKKLEDIASGANRERADKLLNTVGNIAATAANVTNVVSDIKNRKNNNSGGGGTPPFKKGGATKKMQSGGGIKSWSKTNVIGKEKEISEKEAKRVGGRYFGKKSGTIESGNKNGSHTETARPRAGSTRGVTANFKTGGMVNSNSKITASKKATGKSGGTTKAISKTAVKSASPKGKVGGTSTAPKKALPKAQMGAIVNGPKSPGGKPKAGGAILKSTSKIDPTVGGRVPKSFIGKGKPKAGGVILKGTSKAKMGGMKGKSC